MVPFMPGLTARPLTRSLGEPEGHYREVVRIFLCDFLDWAVKECVRDESGTSSDVVLREKVYEMFPNVPWTQDDNMTDTSFIFNRSVHPNPHRTAVLGCYEAHYPAVKGRVSDIRCDVVGLNDLDEAFPTQE